MKHKAIPQKIRKMVYDKYNGHCAYCGCPLEYKDMQVDHVDSIWRTSVAKNGCKDLTDEQMEEANDISNLMPSCRACNFYKGAMDLETFRQTLTNTLLPNTVKTFQFRLAEKYGLVQQTPHEIRFYFETHNAEKDQITE